MMTIFKKISRLAIPLALLFPLTLIFFKPASALTLTLTHEAEAASYTLSWTAVNPSTTDAKVFYHVYQVFGHSTDTPKGTGNQVLVTQDLTVKISTGTGTRCFMVESQDSIVDYINSESGEACHGFIHNLTKEGIQRGDGDGTQRGFDQNWTIKYSLDNDAYMTAKIFPPGTTFSFDDQGFIVAASNPSIRTLVSNVPRSGEMGDHNILMQETWDSRSSTGSIVSNGIYYLTMLAALDPGQVPDYIESPVRSSLYLTIPVDIIRIMNVKAQGITLANSQSTVNYDLTGDAYVRFIVAKPGSKFIVDGSGNIQPSANGITADASLLAYSTTYYRKAGNGLAETWMGVSSTGTVMANGIYPIGLSANDDYGNHAIDNSGNDGPIWTTITVERTPGSDTGTGGGPTDTTGPTVDSVSPANNTTSNTGISTITVVLSDNGGTGLIVGAGSFALRGPLGTLVNFSYAESQGTVQLTNFNPPLTANGAYQLTISVQDVAGNVTTDTSNFTVDIMLSQGSFSDSLIMYPNPAVNQPSATIRYDLAVDATVTVDIYNILGQRVWNTEVAQTSGNQREIPWFLNNTDGEKVGSGVYLVHVKVAGAGGEEVTVTKKLAVVR